MDVINVFIDVEDNIIIVVPILKKFTIVSVLTSFTQDFQLRK